MNNILITFGTTLGITIFNFIGGIITARLLGPVGRGELAAVILWPSILATISGLGISESLIYFSGKNKDRIPQLFSCSIIIAIVQSIIFMTIGYFLIPLFLKKYEPSVVHICQMYLVYIPLFFLTLYPTSLLQGTMKFKKFNFIRIIVIAFFVSGISLLALLGRVTVKNTVLVWITSEFMTLIICVIFLLQEKMISWQIDKMTLKDILSYGWKVHIGNISSLLNSRLDQILLSILLVPTMLGFYVIATTIAGIVSIIPQVFCFVAFPSISNQSNIQEKQKLFAKYFRFVFFLTFIVCFFILILSQWLIPIFYGKEFTDSIKPSQILSLTMFFAGCNIILESGFRALGKPLVSSKAELIGLVVSAIILPIFLIKFQIIGAAIATLITSLVCFSYLLKNSNFSFKDLFYFQSDDLRQVGKLIGLVKN